MFAICLTAEWAAWVAALAAPLHRRLAWRLPVVVTGIPMAHGRRTASGWWRAAGVGRRFRSYYYFLDSVGRKAVGPATVLLGIVNGRIEPAGRLTFAIADTPTRRYGPRVQGAGLHHDPTPGPAGSKLLYGHRWVVLSRVVRHDRFGTIGLPILGPLSIRKKDVPELPPGAGIDFRTKLVMAAEQLAWAGQRLPESSEPPRVVVDGGYARREFLKPAVRSGLGVVARLRKDAALLDRPPVPRPGQKRGPGRPPTSGKNRLSPARRAGQTRGGQGVEVRTTVGQVVTRSVKTFLATWRPAGGVVRVVILKEDDGSWRASLCTEAGAEVAAIVQAVLGRWAIEKDQSVYTPRERWWGTCRSPYHRYRGAA